LCFSSRLESKNRNVYFSGLIRSEAAHVDNHQRFTSARVPAMPWNGRYIEALLASFYDASGAPGADAARENPRAGLRAD
jgi:hypothetical protein